MPDVVKHAWTHRPRSQGGTDPITVATDMPYVYSYFDQTATMTDATPMSLGLLYPSAFYAGSGDPIAEVQNVGNDDGTFVITAEGQIYHVGPPGLLLMTASVMYETDFNANAVYLSCFDGSTMFQPLDSGALHHEMPFTSTRELPTISATWLFWHNGGGFPAEGEDPIDIQTLDCYSFQNSGSDQQASWGHMFVTKLSGALSSWGP